MNDNIKKELEQISPLLATLPNEEVFALPEPISNNAFGLILKAQHKDSELQVPDHYFDQFQSTLITRIQGECTDIDNSTLPSKTINPYEIHTDYFEQLTVQIHQKKDQAKIISLKKKTILWMAAACMTGMIGWLLLATVTKNTTNTNAPMAMSTKGQTEDLDEAINQLESTALFEYLEDGEPLADADWIALSIETDELPDPTEFIQDDETVKQYLHHINQNKNYQSMYDIF